MITINNAVKITIILIGTMFLFSHADAIQITSPSGPLSVDEGATLDIELMADVADVIWTKEFDKTQGTRFAAVGGDWSGVTDLRIVDGNRIVWTPGEEQGGTYTYAGGTKHGEFTLVVIATNRNNPSDTTRDTFTITVNEVNRNPELFGVKDPTTGEVGETMTIRIGGSDMDIPQQTLTYDITIPNGATLDDNTVVWTPTSNDVGSHSISVTLRDGVGGQDTMTIPLTIVEPIPLLPVTNGPPYFVNEGASKDIRVKLNENPGAQVNMAVSGNIISVTPTSLTFDTTNWNTYKTITVTAPNDDNAVDEMASVYLAYNDMNQTLPVTIVDDDEMRISFDKMNIDVTEGTPHTIMIKLTAQPVGTSTIQLSGDKVELEPTTLQFAEADWNMYKSVQVTAPHDADTADTDGSIVMSLGDQTKTVHVDITDDDIPQFVVSSNSLSIAEDGTGTIHVSLDMPPSPRTFYAYVHAGEGIIAEPGVLIFDNTMWNTPQDVTVTPIIDGDNLNTQTQLMLVADRSDITIPITITDNIAMALEVSPLQISLSEGEYAYIDVELTAAPAQPVTITISSDNEDITVHPETLVIDPNGRLDIPILVDTLHDDDAAADSGIITIKATGGYSASQTVSVSITDSDTLDLMWSPSSITMMEGSTNSDLAFWLTAAPTSNVIVDLAAHSNNITLNHGTMTFTPSNWQHKTVTITSLGDTDSSDLATAISIVTTGAITKSGRISVDIIDDDVAQMAIIANSMVSERSYSCMGVVLTAAPSTPVTITITHSNTVKASAQSLTFNSTTWDDTQNVCFTPIRDTDVDHGTATIVFTPSGGLTGIQSKSLTIVDSCGQTSYTTPYLTDSHFSADGTKMFVLEYRTSMIHEYALSTAFDPSTASYTGGACVVGEEPIPNTFFPSASNLFTLGNNEGKVFEYDMTQYAIITSSYTGDAYDVTGASTNYYRDMFFANHGSNMYIIEDGQILTHALSTAYDITTTSLINRHAFNHDSKPTSIYIDGTKMFILGNEHYSVYQFTLSTAYDPSTASYDRSFNVGGVDNQGILFSNDGTKMFILDNDAKSINRYTLSTAYDLSTATYTDRHFITIPGMSSGTITSKSESLHYEPNDFVMMGMSDDTEQLSTQSNNRPTITVHGADSVTLNVGDQYIDAGATCNDPEDGQLTIRHNATSIDTTVAGIQFITYECTDSGGYDAPIKSRTLTIVVPQQDEDVPPQPYVVPNSLINDVWGYAAEMQHGADHVERWYRVLAAFDAIPSMSISEAQEMSDKYMASRWDPIVEEMQKPTASQAVINDVEGYAAETHHDADHVERWYRVLATFDTISPMTAAESKTYASKGWDRWTPVVAALTALESSS